MSKQSDIRSIKDKVMSLLSKAADAGASPAEAQGAMRAAQKLMARYQLSEDELKASTSEDFRETTSTIKVNPTHGLVPHPVDFHLSTAICKYVGCQAWFRRDQSTAELVFFGLEADVELATWLRVAFRKQFDRDWEEYKKFGRKRKVQTGLKSARASFTQGYCDTMRARLEQWWDDCQGSTGERSGNALVLVKHDLVANEMNRRGISLGHTIRASSPQRLDREAELAGSLSADRTQMGRGIDRGPLQLSFKK